MAEHNQEIIWLKQAHDEDLSALNEFYAWKLNEQYSKSAHI